MGRMSELAMEVETARSMPCADRDVDFDVNRLVAVTADLLDHARNRPDLLTRDRNMIADSVQQLGRMIARLSIPHKEAAE